MVCLVLDGESMKPKEKKPEEVYRIINKRSGEAVGSYSRAYCDEYDFSSLEQARKANCHGMFENRSEYKIAKYKVTYELIDGDVDKAGDVPLPETKEEALKRICSKFEIEKWLVDSGEDFNVRFYYTPFPNLDFEVAMRSEFGSMPYTLHFKSFGGE